MRNEVITHNSLNVPPIALNMIQGFPLKMDRLNAVNALCSDITIPRQKLRALQSVVEIRIIPSGYLEVC